MTDTEQFRPRPKQAEVLAYTGGMMGVAAVPGSGKTRTLSYLAASIAAGQRLDDDQEVLIVTLVNSAVDNFARQVGAFVQARGLLPNFGYRVRTLHGLANDIVRDRPSLVGLGPDFKIIDERETNEILQEAVSIFTRSNPLWGEPYLGYDLSDQQIAYVLRDKFPGEIARIAGVFIKQAKDLELLPEQIRRALDRYGKALPLAEMCWQIYADYQKRLTKRGGVDFQDLIRLALKALQADDEYLMRLRQKFPFILEDEAQDSSLLQERILRALGGPNANWVRVGDPNQAIYETFTTAKPEYLRDFLDADNVQSRELPNSGRSTTSIIWLANTLIDWTLNDHPSPAIQRRAPLLPPYIEPTPEGDPQPNPEDNPAGIVLYPDPLTPAKEIEHVCNSVRRWLKDNSDKTVAILAPRNDRGAQVVSALKKIGVETVELLRSTSSTRETAGALTYLLTALSNPNAAPSLAMAYTVWRRDDRDDEYAARRLDDVAKALRACKKIEDYLHPRLDQDWLDSEVVLALIESDQVIHDQLLAFRDLMRRWQAAVVLPIDQLVLTLAQDLFVTAPDLAIAHNLAVYLRQASQSNPHWRLPDFATELKAISQNKRRVIDLGEDATLYDADAHKGKVTVATMHAAKGLEWDRVYLMAVNNYNFPSAQAHDQYLSERWYIRDRLNLEAETRAQLRAIIGEATAAYAEGDATEEARDEYVAERLRLLYVGITRARRELIVTWNTGRDGQVLRATPLVELAARWDARGMS